MEVVTSGANGHPTASIAPAAISPEAVVQHLTDLLEVTLGASPEDLEGPDSLFATLRKQDTLQRCTRFASESQVALYVQKDIVDIQNNDLATNGAEDGSSTGKCEIYGVPTLELILDQRGMPLSNTLSLRRSRSRPRR